MRKLLYLAAGAAMLMASAAYAQNDSAPGDQPAPPAAAAAAADDQAMGSTDPQQDALSPPPQGAPDQAGPAYSSPNQPAPGYYSQGPQGQDQSGYGGAYSNPQANAGSRLYVQEGENQGQSVQIISNAPVPDTKAVRSRFPPLSRAGRRTAPAGN